VSIGQNRFSLTASPEFGHLVVHRAEQYLCVEPATHVANGFNLAEAGVVGTGSRTLEPGETLSGSIVIGFSR
jgi:aldose 1-epimerase